MSNNVKIFISIIVILVLGVVSTILLKGNGGTSEPGKYDVFAQCLKDQGAVFYGTFWCTYCQSQKKLFGSSQKLLPYVECSPANAKGQLQICQDKKIEGYPTWEFADGSRISGKVSLEKLAEKTACVLPTETNLE